MIMHRSTMMRTGFLDLFKSYARKTNFFLFPSFFLLVMSLRQPARELIMIYIPSRTTVDQIIRGNEISVWWEQSGKGGEFWTSFDWLCAEDFDRHNNISSSFTVSHQRTKWNKPNNTFPTPPPRFFFLSEIPNQKSFFFPPFRTIIHLHLFPVLLIESVGNVSAGFVRGPIDAASRHIYIQD